MRIEHQGTVSVRPPYSHVGYTSAQPSGDDALPVAAMSLTGFLITFGLLLASVSTRVKQRGDRGKAAVLGVAAALLVVGACVAFTLAVM